MYIWNGLDIIWIGKYEGAWDMKISNMNVCFINKHVLTFIRARFPSFWEDKSAESGGNSGVNILTNIANINFIVDLHNYQHPRDSGSGIMSSKSYANFIILA